MEANIIMCKDEKDAKPYICQNQVGLFSFGSSVPREADVSFPFFKRSRFHMFRLSITTMIALGWTAPVALHACRANITAPYISLQPCVSESYNYVRQLRFDT